MPDTVCPRCGCALEESKSGTKYICTNDDCTFLVKKADFQGEEKPWTVRLCDDQSLWCQEAFETYPSIIAHEYWRLYELLQQGQPYGALFQLKDLLEVLLKFPVLAVASGILANKYPSDLEKKILSIS